MSQRLVVVLAMMAFMALFRDDFGAHAGPIVKPPTTATPKKNSNLMYFNSYRRYLGWWYPRYNYNRYPYIQYPVQRPQFPPITNRPLYPPFNRPLNRPFNRPLYPPVFQTLSPPVLPPQPPISPTSFPPINRPQFPTATQFPGINQPPFQTPLPYPGYPGNRPFVPWTMYPPVNPAYPTVRPRFNTPGYRPTSMPLFPGYPGQFPRPTIVPNFGYPGLNNPFPYGPSPYKKGKKALKRLVKKVAEGG